MLLYSIYSVSLTLCQIHVTTDVDLEYGYQVMAMCSKSWVWVWIPRRERGYEYESKGDWTSGYEHEYQSMDTGLRVQKTGTSVQRFKYWYGYCSTTTVSWYCLVIEEKALMIMIGKFRVKTTIVQNPWWEQERTSQYWKYHSELVQTIVLCFVITYSTEKIMFACQIFFFMP